MTGCTPGTVLRIRGDESGTTTYTVEIAFQYNCYWLIGSDGSRMLIAAEAIETLMEVVQP